MNIVEGTMNPIKYVQVLEGRLLRQVREWFPGNNFIFQQDDTPCHAGKISVIWFSDNKIRMLKLHGNSPDMNPIENLWNILKDEIHAELINRKRELMQSLILVWFHSDKIMSPDLY